MVHKVVKWIKLFSKMTTENIEVLPSVSDDSTLYSYEKLVKMRGSSLREDEQNIDTLIQMADTFSRLERFKDATDIYARAFSFENTDQGKLYGFVQALSEKGRKSCSQYISVSDELPVCYFCHGILVEPVTLPCGHTYCRRCLLKRDTCIKCSTKFKPEDVSSLKTNVTVVNIMEKMCSKEVQAARLRLEGDDFRKEGDLVSAVAKYTEAEKLDPHDHVVQNCLSKTLLTMQKPKEALCHAEKGISLNPTCTKAYLNKACAQASLGQQEGAVISYMKHLALGESSHSVETDTQKLIYKLLKSQKAQKSDKEGLSDYPKSVRKQPQPHTCLSLSTLCEDSLNLQKWMTDCRMWRKERDVLNKIVEGFEYEIKKIKDDHGNASLRVREYLSITKKDLECPLCIRLFWQPVSTPCGHMFCRMCLDRSLDHKPHCPLCKNSLSEYLAERCHSTTEFVENLLHRFLPNAYQERKKAFEEEMEELASAGKDAEHGVPLFVCTMAYPGVPCPLHIFEPRYRLMTRQCMESGTREFGMCAPQEDEINRIAKFGTMLVIRELSYYPDGRSVVDTIGSKRFKVLQTSMRDGYHVGSVEFISDCPVPETEEPAVRSLHDTLRAEVSDWFSTVPDVTRTRVLQHFGPLPIPEESYLHSANGPRWLWWTLAILPIGVKTQVQILGIDSLKRRMESIQRVLRFVRRFGPQGVTQ